MSIDNLNIVMSCFLNGMIRCVSQDYPRTEYNKNTDMLAIQNQKA
jgi:hypothetical protein